MIMLNKDNLKQNIAIRLRSKEEAKKMSKWCKENCIKEDILRFYQLFKEDTCCYLYYGEMFVEHITPLRDDGVEIINFSDLEFDAPVVGVKRYAGKTKISLVDPCFVEDIAKVLTKGAEKYPKKDNWKYVDNAKERYTDALLRHLIKYLKGENLDESGFSNLACMGANLMFLMHFERQGFEHE